jgi:hypothetical protein
MVIATVAAIGAPSMTEALRSKLAASFDPASPALRNDAPDSLLFGT